MSFEAEIQRHILNLTARIEKMEALYPGLYMLMINLRMMADTNTETAKQVVELMDGIKVKLENIQKFMCNMN